MATTTSKLEICINKDITNIIRAKQMDSNSRFLQITLLQDDGTPYDLTGHTARFNARKSDGKFVFNDCVMTDATNGIITVELTDQTLAIGDSKVVADISVLNSNGTEVLTTRTFEIMVQTTIRNKNAIESSDEYGAVVTLFQDVWDLREYIRSIGKYPDDVPGGGVPASSVSLWGALNKVYNMMLTQSFIGLDVIIFAQTIRQNINDGSVDWAFDTALRSGKLGMLIDALLNLGDAEVQDMMTWEEVIASDKIMSLVPGSKNVMTAFAASSSAMALIAANAKVLNMLCKSDYASALTESANNTAVFETALKTCGDDPDHFTILAVPTLTNNTAGVEYFHNASSNAWTITKPTQKALYFPRRVYLYAATSSLNAYGYDGTKSVLATGGTSGNTVTTATFACGTISTVYGNIASGYASTAAQAILSGVSGAAFIPV